jgi:hypothetical protein
MERVLVTLVVLAALGVPAPASAVAPSASFTYSPAAPLTLEPVTFTSTSTGDVSGIAWDLDNDGFFDDGTGQQAILTFPSSAVYTVRLRAVGPGGSGEQTQPVRVANRPPTAQIASFPAAPKAGEAVSFVALPEDADGTVASEAWDLDGDGVFESAGPLVTHTFDAPGSFEVRLRVLDNDGAPAEASQVVHVEPKPLEPLSPFPLVHVSGSVSARGAHIRRLVVQAPSGATVTVRCHGGGCPVRRQVKKAPATGRPSFLRFRRFERTLRPHAVLRILVTKPGTIGKYTRLTIRAGKQPLRSDLCLRPGAKRPSRCTQ